MHLFDLAADVGERDDLAPRRPERVEELRALLHGWQRRMDAKFLRPKDGAEPWRPDR